MNNDLKNAILKCQDCKELFGFTPNPIFQGNLNAKIFQISQAPSKNVHITNKPFDDASGKTLRKKWYQIPNKDFYNKNNFYITAMGHCYPGKNSKGGDRKPPIRCADKWLKKEIKLAKNKLFILIGSYAASYFFKNKKLTELIYNNQKINNKLAVILPHPSPLNRFWLKNNPNFEKKRLYEIRKVIYSILYN